MDQFRPWQATVAYSKTAYVVGCFATLEQAKAEAMLQAMMRSEERIYHLDVTGKNGAWYRQHWHGRRAMGDWIEKARELPAADTSTQPKGNA